MICETGHKILHLRNVGPDTNMRDLLALFWARCFHVTELRLVLKVPCKFGLVEAFVSLPEDELAEAQKWASGLSWHGLSLVAAVIGPTDFFAGSPLIAKGESNGNPLAEREQPLVFEPLLDDGQAAALPGCAVGVPAIQPPEAKKGNEKEIAIQLIALMAHIEGISEENQFVPPIHVNATDRDGTVWDFEYSPFWDSVDLLQVAPTLPIALQLQDANGSIVETRITDLTLRPEWLKPFLQ